MATYAEIEDLRDWYIDMIAEMLARLDVINGEEPALLMDAIRRDAEKAHESVKLVLMNLDAILVGKKRESPLP